MRVRLFGWESGPVRVVLCVVVFWLAITSLCIGALAMVAFQLLRALWRLPTTVEAWLRR